MKVDDSVTIEPLRVLLGLSPAPVQRRNICGGALLRLTDREQQGLAREGVAFAHVIQIEGSRAHCRVSCGAVVPKGTGICGDCVELERTARDELKRLQEKR